MCQGEGGSRGATRSHVKSTGNGKPMPNMGTLLAHLSHVDIQSPCIPLVLAGLVVEGNVLVRLKVPTKKLLKQNLCFLKHSGIKSWEL